MPRLRFWLPILGFVLSSPALATTLVKTDLPTLTKTSDVIVRGKVKKVAMRWSRDHSRILTEVEVEVSESLKGSPGATVRILQPGGVVGNIGQTISGLARFTEGEDLVLFLR